MKAKGSGLIRAEAAQNATITQAKKMSLRKHHTKSVIAQRKSVVCKLLKLKAQNTKELFETGQKTTI